jgi:hypothetical protein
MHLLLFAALGVLVVFLSGVMQHLLWILLGGMVFVALSGYLFYRRLLNEGKTLGEMLRSPMFKGRSLEVSLLGGMVTLKLDKHGEASDIKAIDGKQQPPLQLEDLQSTRVRDIDTLATLLEKELITPDEFAKAKKQLLGP